MFCTSVACSIVIKVQIVAEIIALVFDPFYFAVHIPGNGINELSIIVNQISCFIVFVIIVLEVFVNRYMCYLGVCAQGAPGFRYSLFLQAKKSSNTPLNP